MNLPSFAMNSVVKGCRIGCCFHTHFHPQPFKFIQTLNVCLCLYFCSASVLFAVVVDSDSFMNIHKNTHKHRRNERERREASLARIFDFCWGFVDSFFAVRLRFSFVFKIQSFAPSLCNFVTRINIQNHNLF